MVGEQRAAVEESQLDSSDFAKRGRYEERCLRTRRRDATGKEEEREESKVGYNDEKIQRAKEEAERNVKRRKGRLKPAERTRKNGSLAVRVVGGEGARWAASGGERARKVARDKALDALRGAAWRGVARCGAAGAPGAVVGG
ncbi:hypothetical protein K0M31_010436 [Melipona bicolor]|uniref:Uncharacterized protein n=1 Tax=Melipona bicolor TaxID=60889 RepID=A0AA40FMT9_9HYME|nr:hypothetical protein K0M31_010436 [Melipona bicolor]